MATCNQCHAEFEITDQDRAFYVKMDVPEPKLCYPHRRQHLLSWRNQRNLYARTCDATKKPIISIFAPNSTYTVYDRDYWWSDAWDPTTYGQEIDFTKTFAEQFNDLMHKVPLAGLLNARNENSQYTNHTGFMKDSHMCFACWECENLLYSDVSQKCKDSLDILESMFVENGYALINCSNCFNTKYAQHAERCNDSWFLFDCKDCSHCIGCTDLRNKEFYIFNQPYTKEQFEEKVRSLRLDSREGIHHAQERFRELVSKSVHRYAQVMNSERSTGNFISAVKNFQWGFSVKDSQDSAYCINATNIRDVYDGYGIATLERGYMLFDSGVQGMELLVGGIIWGCQFTYYSYNCHSSYEIFGCTGLRNKKFCIFNKQYSEEEYKILKAKLIAHMKETGEWGEFFPPAISPFGYNETLSDEYLPLTQAEAQQLGFKWQDTVSGTRGKETLKLSDVPHAIVDTPDSITKELLVCEVCGKNYKIVAQELAFYRKQNLPIPTVCPTDRYKNRLAQRLPHLLWHTRCRCQGTVSLSGAYTNTSTHSHGTVACPNEFESPYAPERTESVYCEECYQAEV